MPARPQPEGQQDADAHPEEPRNLAVEGRCPHAEAQRRVAEQDEGPGHEREDGDEDEEVEVGEGDGGGAHLQAALGEGGREAAAGIAVDRPGQPLEDDQQPDGHDDGIQLGLAVERADQHALGHRPDGEPDEEHQHEGPPVARGPATAG